MSAIHDSPLKVLSSESRAAAPSGVAEIAWRAQGRGCCRTLAVGLNLWLAGGDAGGVLPGNALGSRERKRVAGLTLLVSRVYFLWPRDRRRNLAASQLRSRTRGRSCEAS